MSLFVKTEAGQQVLKDRSVPLTPRQRSAFILFDGKRSVDDVLAATASMGVSRADVEHLVQVGLLADIQRTQPMPGAAPPQAVVDGEGPRTAQERYAAAYPLAIKLTSSLGLRGFRLNLAVEAATSFDELLAVAPRIRDAVGAERYLPLQQVLGG